MQGSARSEAGFMHMAPQEGHPHMQMHRAPASRMVRTMSVPHMAMGPGPAPAHVQRVQRPGM